MNQVLSHGNLRNLANNYTCMDTFCFVMEIFVFILILLVVIIMLSLIFYQKYFQLQNIRRNDDSIENKEIIIPIQGCTIFQSGRWSTYFYCYRTIYGPDSLQIDFDFDQLTLNSDDTDDFGDYKFTGRFSRTDLTMNIIKTYITHTNDSVENFYEKINIDLVWNKSKQIFEGTWFVNTDDCKDNGIFILIKEKEN